MIDSLLHLFGFCPDHATHINFIDYAYYFGLYDIQLLINITINNIKQKLTTLFR